MLQQDPPPGVAVALKEGDRQLDRFRCQILGVPGTPFEEGVFEVDVAVGERYPFEPPSVRFLTPVYHPNIDKEGRICLDLLKMPPAGSWKPSLNLSSLLTSIRVLLGAPNPDDGLMADISVRQRYPPSPFAERFPSPAPTARPQPCLCFRPSTRTTVAPLPARHDAIHSSMLRSMWPR